MDSSPRLSRLTLASVSPFRKEEFFPLFCFLPPFTEEQLGLMVCVGALALSFRAEACSGAVIGSQTSASHVNGMRMWVVWLHPWVTTDSARAFSWSGSRTTGVQGPQPAEPRTPLAKDPGTSGGRALCPAPWFQDTQKPTAGRGIGPDDSCCSL